ncbi:MAG: DUF1553 domain-containing protein [Planctomycetaceae bacterium]|nr:DUF1553 domain-containing protein [Planctomycetaceae bacterium]
MPVRSIILSLLNGLAIVLAWGNIARAEKTLDFARDVRPILADHCFRCHGFDERTRMGNLRLDHFAGATTAADSGLPAIVPGQIADSELLRRINSHDESELMPPAEIGKPLSASQKRILQLWVESGAQYETHWSFTKPVAVPLPDTGPLKKSHPQWSAHPIDRFVAARLASEGLEPSVPTEPSQLLRRVSLDLTGLPPSVSERERFLADVERVGLVSAYESAVNRLLASPQYGERMALEWLDAARYADTNGFFGDRPRQIWPWRDWVIAAFNDNMPFDQFTIEQLAGDLLPSPTRSQLVATGFHRNAMANNETGIIDEEFRVEAVVDRVETTSTVWLGLTLACAQCHDHKFDPLSQRDYFRFYAYFNNSVEPGLVTADDPPPTLEVPTPEQSDELLWLTRRRQAAQHQWSVLEPAVNKQITLWEQTLSTQFPPLPTDPIVTYSFDEAEGAVIPDKLSSVAGVKAQAGEFDGDEQLELSIDWVLDQPWTIGVWIKPVSSLGCVWSKIEPTGRRRGIELIWQKGRIQINLVHRWGENELHVLAGANLSAQQWHQVVVSFPGHNASGPPTLISAHDLAVYIDGQPAKIEILRDTLTGTLHNDETLKLGRRDSGLGYYGQLDELMVLPRTMTATAAADWYRSQRLGGILTRPESERSVAEQNVLRDDYIKTAAGDEVRTIYAQFQQARQSEQAARKAIPTTLIMQDLDERRPTHLLIRGQYDAPGEIVEPGTPSLFTPLPDQPPNRLGLARWLVSAEHPLTARVAVNRLWKLCFGEGLVRTVDNFGTQGELPTHPELLDWLAIKYRDGGWDTKAMLKLIVTSQTYQQQSAVSPRLRECDPDNLLLARGPRFRLPGELIRDQALAVSGLLNYQLGGPSVKPWQPPGLWKEVSYNGEETYVADDGPAQFRRSLYTFWKRQAPPPALQIFDAGTREKCLATRSRTNTPLQALVQLNDPLIFQAARKLADTVVEANPLPNGPTAERGVLQQLFQYIVCRDADAAELALLSELFDQQRKLFERDERAALEVSGDAIRDELTIPRAVWTQVAHTILNLDEMVMRR